MAQFHFVEDYERHVANLMASMPLDQAMEAAVGGSFDLIGGIECQLLNYAGLRSGMALVDLGCGSGRLARALGRSEKHVEYVGIDIVQALLDYAATQSPASYRFLKHQELSIPLASLSMDFACAFSVFTHLLHHESYLYIEDFHRVLKPGGKLLFSFLEFAAPAHWTVFRNTADQQKASNQAHLNSFIERNAIEIWADQAGFVVEGFIGGHEAIGGSPPLGQSSAILRKA